MQKDKNKKKTLTISSSFNKKFDSTSFDQSGKKSFSVDKKKVLKLLLNLKNFHRIYQGTKANRIKKILQEN